ncbi:MAG TPA: homoserine dehydrogenase, partial [Desulfobaccales bacterium]
QGVVRLLTERREFLARRLGTDLVLKKVAEIDPERRRQASLEPEQLTAQDRDILEDPDIDIVVELIGGTARAREIVLEAISRGRHVVTANKALLAVHGNEILTAAAQKGVDVAFEAAVCGGVPLILALRQGLAANRIEELFGILNGTANYILTQMSQQGDSFILALRQAQEKGFAEADPTLDVEGVDTAHKLAILMSLAYGSRLDLESIAVEGISKLDPLDLQFAGEFGYCLKLLAITRDDGYRIEARVHPTLIPRDHMLANVHGAMNAVHVTGNAAGPILLYGQGAGMMPTASAVVSDILDVARNLRRGAPCRIPPLGCPDALSTARLIKPMNDLVTNYYFRFAALDRPGVLSQVSGILGKYDISIAAVIQKGREVAGTVPIVMITHEAREADAQQAMREIDQLPVVSPPAVFYRIEDPQLHSAQI